MAVILENTVQDAAVQRVLNAFNGMAGKNIAINSHEGNMRFEYEPKQEGENDKQFGERVLRELGKNLMKLYERNLDYERYQSAISEVPEATENVPDNILT